MKYLRCPHCGEPGISKIGKNLFSKTHYNLLTLNYEDFLHKDKGEACVWCNKRYAIRPRYSWTLYILACIGVAATPILWLILSIVLCDFDEDGIFLFIFLVLLMPGVTAAVAWTPRFMCAPIPIDEETLKSNGVVSNVSVELLEIAKNIHNYDIHAIKFDVNTLNVVFLERFKNKEVPIMFLKKTRAQLSPVEAKIIGIEFVPDDLLFVGSSFSIVDLNGTIIGKGKIHKIYQ